MEIARGVREHSKECRHNPYTSVDYLVHTGIQKRKHCVYHRVMFYYLKLYQTEINASNKSEDERNDLKSLSTIANVSTDEGKSIARRSKRSRTQKKYRNKAKKDKDMTRDTINTFHSCC